MTISIEETVVKEVAKKVVGKVDTDALAAKVAKELNTRLPKLVCNYFLDRDYLSDCVSASKMMDIIISHVEQNLTKKLGIKNVR